MVSGLRQHLDQPQRHVVVAADEGVRQGQVFPDPALGHLHAVAGAPGAGDDLYVLLRDAVFPAGVQEAVAALHALGTAVFQYAGQVDQFARAVAADDVVGDVVHGQAVVQRDQRAALHGAVDGDGGDARFDDAPGDGLSDAAEHDLVALDQKPVKLRQVGQVEYGVLAQILRGALILAEAVEDPQVDVAVIVGILFQAVQRGFHQFIIPVRSEIGNVIGFHFLLPLLTRNSDDYICIL